MNRWFRYQLTGNVNEAAFAILTSRFESGSWFFRKRNGLTSNCDLYYYFFIRSSTKETRNNV